MALRVTQQSVELLSEATGGKLRVTQFYLEVLGEPGASPDITQTLGISDSATDVLIPGGIPKSASNALTLTDVATTQVIHSPSITDTLVFTQSAVTDKPVSASSALVFTDQVNREFDVSAASALTFSDIAYQNIKNLSAADALALIQTARQNNQNLSAADILTLSQIANDSAHLFTSSALAFTDLASQRIKQVAASSALALTDSVVVTVIHNPNSQLSLSDSVQRAVIFRRSAADVLALSQAVAIFIDRKGVLCNYSPFVGTGPFTISNVAPILTPSTLTLFWPIVSPSLTCVLKNADFGNKIGYTTNRIYRKSRGGTKIIFRKPTWPKWVTLHLDVSVLTQTQIDSFKSFINQTLGLEVGIKDHDGIMWKGIITNPDTDITQTGGKTCAQYATSIQFEGQLIP